MKIRNYLPYLFLFVSIQLFSQTEPLPKAKGEIRLAGPELLLGSFGIYYEKYIDDNSIVVAAKITGMYSDFITRSGAGLEFQYRNYFGNAGLSDLNNIATRYFTTILLSANYLKSDNRSYSRASTGFLIGCKSHVSKYIVLDFSGGGEILFTESQSDRGIIFLGEGYNGVRPVFKLSFGYKF